jgi:hypothetical protein
LHEPSPGAKFSPVKRQPELHHYVPQFYLRQWCDDEGKLVVYPLDGRPPFRTATRNVAAECNLYTPIPGAPAVRDDHEQWFSGWEGHFAKVWPQIFDRGDNPKTRKNLARFLATLLIRHPAAREVVGDINKRLFEMASSASDQSIIAIRGRYGEASVSVGEIRQFVSVAADEIRTDWLRHMPEVARSLGDQLFRRPWGLVFAETDSFITSDNPVALDRGACRRVKFGIGTPGSLVFFPVSPQRFLVIADEWEWAFMHYKLHDRGVFIRRVVRTADRFVFARNEDPMIIDAIAARGRVPRR